jgi:hypothetical protein
MPDTQDKQDSAKDSKDQIALELMKFVAMQSGYGKSVGQSAGFGAKGANSPEQYADSLLELFQRCRKIVKED